MKVDIEKLRYLVNEKVVLNKKEDADVLAEAVDEIRLLRRLAEIAYKKRKQGWSEQEDYLEEIKIVDQYYGEQE